MQFSKTAHLQKADHNRQFSDDITQLPDDYRDWRITAIFYAALHILQAYFVAKNTEYPTKHQERDELIQRDPNLRTLWDDYRELKTLSVTSRYQCLPINDFDITEAKQHFDAIRNHVMSLLK